MLSRISAIQMCSTLSVEKNLALAKKIISDSADQKNKLIVLPEMFALMGKNYQDKLSIAEKFGEGPIQNFLSQQAKEKNIWLIGGTIPIQTETKNKVRAACLVYNPQGECVARYDKIHLFDVIVSSNEEHRESLATEHGDQPVVVDTPFGKLGLAVCYDIRFPELFRVLLSKGAEILVVPAAFTATTGKAHWELLLRARAVENFCYVIGAAQSGHHENGRDTFGHSLIINPWGEILSCLPEKEGFISAEIDLEKLHELRKNFPAIEHRRIF